MAKILCVLYNDPVTGYPKNYALNTIPKIDHYPGGQTAPTPNISTSPQAPCSAASPANSASANISKASATPLSSPPTKKARTLSSIANCPMPTWSSPSPSGPPISPPTASPKPKS